MTRPERLPVAIEYGPVVAAGLVCPNCGDPTNRIEAVVTLAVVEDGERGSVETDREVCSDCVWHVIRDEHVRDAAPHVLLAYGAPVPPGVHDPLAPTS